jgi:hypothetical protein
MSCTRWWHYDVHVHGIWFGLRQQIGKISWLMAWLIIMNYNLASCFFLTVTQRVSSKKSIAPWRNAHTQSATEDAASSVD